LPGLVNHLFSAGNRESEKERASSVLPKINLLGQHAREPTFLLYESLLFFIKKEDRSTFFQKKQKNKFRAKPMVAVPLVLAAPFPFHPLTSPPSGQIP